MASYEVIVCYPDTLPHNNLNYTQAVQCCQDNGGVIAKISSLEDEETAELLAGVGLFIPFSFTNSFRIKPLGLD